MVPWDKLGPRIRRPVGRSSPLEGAEVEDPKTEYILAVAAENPNFTADEVHAEIHYARRRHDITKAMVRKVLAKRRTARRFNR